MELENAIKSLKEFAYTNYGTFSQKEAKLILQALDNSIPKEKVKEIIKKIEKYEDIAREQIQERIVVADSDSLNFGRKQAHGKDIEELKLLLEE